MGKHDPISGEPLEPNQRPDLGDAEPKVPRAAISPDAAGGGRHAARDATEDAGQVIEGTQPLSGGAKLPPSSIRRSTSGPAPAVDATKTGAESSAGVPDGGLGRANDSVKDRMSRVSETIRGSAAPTVAGISGEHDLITSGPDPVPEAATKTRDDRVATAAGAIVGTGAVARKPIDFPKREPLKIRRNEYVPPRTPAVEPVGPANRRRWLVPALVALLGLALIGGIAVLANRDSGKNGEGQAIQPSVAITTANPTPTGPTTNVVPAGTWVKDGKIEFRVTKASCDSARIGTAADGKDAALGHFCTVTMHVRNTGTTSWTYDPALQKGYGADKVWYTNDTGAAALANPGVDLSAALAAGTEADIVTAYDVPTTVGIDIAEIHASPTSPGAWSHTH